MTLTTHTLRNGQRIRLMTLTGTVVSASKSSHTSVQQTAPTVMSKNMVIPGRVYSTTHTDQELWLRTADGKEESVTLTNLHLPVREGHQMSVVWGGPDWAETCECFGARNHVTEESRCDITVLGKSLRQWKLAVGAGSSFAVWSLGAAFGLAVAAFFFYSGSVGDKLAMAVLGAMGGAIAGTGAWLFFGSNLGPARRAVALTEEINELGRAALMRESADASAVPGRAQNTSA